MAGSTTSPMSVKEIAAKAAFDWNPYIPLKHWLRTADLLLTQARIYEDEENYQQAYMLFMRYATLIAEKLPLHPDASKPEYKKALKIATFTLADVLDRLAALKPGINAKYESWQQELARRRESVKIRDFAGDVRYSLPSASIEDSDPAIAGHSTLAAEDHGDLAVKLAHKEFRRRDAARRATRQAGISEEEEQERRTAGLWDNWESALTKDGRTVPDDDLQRRMTDTRQQMDQPHDIRPDFARKTMNTLHHSKVRPAQISKTDSSYKYPIISKPQVVRYEDWNHDPSTASNDFLPPVPAKERLYERDLYNGAIPPRPEKQPIYERSHSPTSTPSPPSPVELEETSGFTFRPSAYLENGSPLRTVFLPTRLRERFLAIAAPNTRNNLETCGILCGTLIKNALFISRLVIPEQKSTSDTCETTDESALFDYCDKEDLMVLGWIHTHPTQTCFMSSRDLHTHCGYQVMMAESIAIVCAPSKTPSWGVFRMTDPPGMQSVLNCRQTGLFHPHSEHNVYTDALRPGHVLEAEGLEFETIDMRGGPGLAF